MVQIGLAERPRQTVFFNDEPKVPNFICTPTETARKRFNCEGVYGHGSGRTNTEAKIRSIGEFYERLCIENPDLSRITHGTYSEGAHADPRSFMCYSNEQYTDKIKHMQSLLTSNLDWYPAYDLLQQKEVHVPASLIFLYADFNDECEIRREQITTGTAFSTNGEAAKTGILEAVERDAYITAYLTKRKPARLLNLPADAQKLLDYLSRYRLEAHVFDITTDLLVPTFMTVTVDRTGIGPAIDVGASAGYNTEQAVYSSIKESIQARCTSRYLVAMGYKPVAGEIRTLQDRYYCWYDIATIRHLDFWLDRQNFMDFDCLPEYSRSIAETMSVLADADFHVYGADISIPDISDANFEVVKVLIPELHPLYLDERAKSLYSVHAGAIHDDKSLYPHPFA